jgi:multidrug efflux system membrane fusion protein
LQIRFCGVDLLRKSGHKFISLSEKPGRMSRNIPKTWLGLEWMKKHLLVSTVLVVLLLYLGFQWASSWLVLCRDAYLTSDLVTISPEVSGPMLTLAVSNNQAIEGGALLFSVDPKPFQIEVDRQRATLEVAKADLARTVDQLSLANADIQGKNADYQDAVKNRDRAVELAKGGDISQESLDNLRRAFQVALANLNQTRAAKVIAEQDVTAQNARIRQTEVALAKAEFELSRTEVRSPAAGRVAPFQLRPGSYLEAGKPVMALLTEGNWRVVANLDERHLSGLRPGRAVWFSLGSDPWRVHAGRVRSLSPGVSRTPAAANVLPYVAPDTDWIRLPRRLPVEIDIGDLPKQQLLFMGTDATVWWMNP